MKHLSLLLLLMLCSIGILQAQVELAYCEDIDHGFGEAGVIYTPYVQFVAEDLTPYIGNSIKAVVEDIKTLVKNAQ